MGNDEFYGRMGVPDVTYLLAEARRMELEQVHRDDFSDSQVILHPTHSRVARACTAGTMVRYSGGLLPLPEVEEENDGSILSKFLSNIHVSDY